MALTGKENREQGMQMDKEQYRRAKASLVFSMQEGYSWQTSAASAGLGVSQSNAYRLWRAFRRHGETALSDGRHGHPCKLRGAVRAFLEERCRHTPQTPSSTIQMELQEHFDLSVSISQINRVRAALGVSNHSKYPEPGEFVPLQVDQQGKVIREVALASFLLPLPERSGQELEVRVALIQDWRRLAPKALSVEEEDLSFRWDEKLDGTHEYWLDESWQATSSPFPPLFPTLTREDFSWSGSSGSDDVDFS
jgi:transposase